MVRRHFLLHYYYCIGFDLRLRFMATIRLAASSDAVALVHVGKHTASYFLGWEKAKFCYLKSCKEVFGAFSSYRAITPNFSPHFLLTEGSKHWIRDDRISGPLLWCYNLNLLGELVKAVSSRELFVECDAPAEFLRECVRRYSMELVGHQGGLITRRSVSLLEKLKINAKTVSYRLRQDIAYSKRIYASICKRRKFSASKRVDRADMHVGSTKEPEQRQVVFTGIQGLTTHRFGSLLRAIDADYEQIAFFPHEDLSTDNLSCPSFSSIYGLISSYAFIGLLCQTVYLLFIQEICLWIMRIRHPLLVTYFRQQYRDILQVVLGLHGIKELFASRKPAVAIIQGSYNGPHTKRILHAAHLARVPTILIEQKIILPNQFAYQYMKGDWVSGMPTSYIVAHNASRSALISWGIDPSRIHVGYRGPILNIEKTEYSNDLESGESGVNEVANHSRSRQCLLILLSDSKRVNLSILSYIEEFANDKYCFLLREHPNVPLHDQPDVIQFFAGTCWANCTSQSWTLLESFQSVIAIAACSSAGLEAVEYGAFLVWLPFCTDLSVTYASMIDSIGRICTTSQELEELVSSIRDRGAFRTLYNSQRKILNDLGLSPTGDLVSSTLKLVKALL